VNKWETFLPHFALFSEEYGSFRVSGSFTGS